MTAPSSLAPSKPPAFAMSGAALRATATDPAVINLLQDIPVGDANNQVSFVRPDRQDFNEVLGMVDHSFSQNDKVSGRYFYDRFFEKCSV